MPVARRALVFSGYRLLATGYWLLLVHVFEAEAALDAQVAARHVVVDRRHDLEDLLILDVHRQRAADAAVRADRVGDGLRFRAPLPCLPQIELRLRPSTRRWDTPGCSCRNTRTRNPAAARRAPSKCAHRSRGRPRRSRTCSARRCRTLRRTCSRARTCRNRGRRDRCRPSPAARRRQGRRSRRAHTLAKPLGSAPYSSSTRFERRRRRSNPLTMPAIRAPPCATDRRAATAS